MKSHCHKSLYCCHSIAFSYGFVWLLFILDRVLPCFVEIWILGFKNTLVHIAKYLRNSGFILNVLVGFKESFWENMNPVCKGHLNWAIIQNKLSSLIQSATPPVSLQLLYTLPASISIIICLCHAVPFDYCGNFQVACNVESETHLTLCETRCISL